MDHKRIAGGDDYGFDYGDDADAVSDNENDLEDCDDSKVRTVKMKYQQYSTAGG